MASRLTNGSGWPIAQTLVAPLAWGTSYVVTAQWTPSGHPLFSAVARALPFGLLVLLLVRRLPPPGWRCRVCILGTLNVGIFYPALFVTSHLMPGGVAAVLNSGVPLVVMLAAPLYGDRAAGWRLGWAILGIAGVALVARPTDQVNGLGIVAGLVAMTALAMAVVLSKRWGHPPGTGVWLLSGWQLTAGGCVLLPFALLEGVPRDLGPETVAAYLWLGGVAGLVAYAAWFAGIRRLDAAGVAAIGLVSPVVAMALGLLVDERPSSWQVLGAALVLSSALLCQRSFAPGPEVTVMPSVDGVPRHPSRTAALAPQPRPAGRPDQAEPDDYA